MAIKNSAINISVERLSDGFLLHGGQTRRKLQVVGNHFELKDAAGVVTLGLGTTFDTKVFTFPSATDTLVGVAAEQTLTNKTLTSPTLSSPVINFGSDANGDLIVRAAGAYTRLPVGTDGQVLTVVSGAPAWSSGSLHSQNTDTGTTSQSFAIDSDGFNVSLKALDATSLATYRADGTTFAHLETGNVNAAVVNATHVYASDLLGVLDPANSGAVNGVKIVAALGVAEVRNQNTSALAPISVSAATTTGNVTVGGHIKPSATDFVDPNEVAFVNSSGNLVGDAKFIWNPTTSTLQLLSGASLTVNGDLTVQGTTTTIDSATVAVADKNIELGTVATPTDVTADGGGITLKGDTDKTITWVAATNNWLLNQNVDIPTGKTYKINNVTILSATALGSSVVSSSLTSVGTLATGVWNASVIGLAYGGTGKNLTAVAGGVVYTDADSMEVTAAGTAGQVLVSNGSSAPSWQDPGLAVAAYALVSSDVTIDVNTSTLKKYVNKSGSQCVITIDGDLPVGREIVIAGVSANGWRVVAEAASGVKFVFGDVESAANGNISSTHGRDCVTLVKVSSTEIMVVSAVGNLELDQA